MSDEKRKDSSDTFYLADEIDEVLRRDVRIHRKSSPDATTQVPCPWCDGLGMVTAEKSAEWRAAHPELSKKPGETA